MAVVDYQGVRYSCREEETILEALHRQGVELKHSCKKGVCNACMMKSVDSAAEELATGRLNEELVQAGYFLPCQTRVSERVSMVERDNRDIVTEAVVLEKTLLAPGIARLVVEPAYNPEYSPGQFIEILHPSGASRPYSLACTPETVWGLECHVQAVEGGLVSNWLVDEVAEGDTIKVSKPAGEVLLPADAKEVAMLAFGVGMSSVHGVCLDALQRQGDEALDRVELIHLARTQPELYLDDLYQQKSAELESFHYQGIVGSGRQDRLLEKLCAQLAAGDDKLVRHYILCGSPAAVWASRDVLVDLGVSEGRIHADAFDLAHQIDEKPDTAAEPVVMSDALRAEMNGSLEGDLEDEEKPYPETHPELWAALVEGDRLQKILSDFYDEVFEDPIMSPYFQNFTKQRSKEKVYSFYKRVFSGESSFFGDRPRNSHHWMVITDEIYDYRLDMLARHMRNHGLPEHLVQVWLSYDEYYRSDIVKTEPRGRRIGGIVQPAGGFGREVLTVGAECDSCHTILDEGIEVLYHLRTGKIYCPNCETE
ncbi:MAG: 2Fe-2S iron-sulfur cluster-binding protein [Oceanobacter sp.]